MNKEQAVSYLRFSGFSDEQIKAIEGAFSCPSAGVDCEDCPAYEDAIGRKAVLNTLENMDRALDENRTVESYKDLLRECYKVLPSVTPKPNKWIPVSERLPEKYSYTLWCASSGCVRSDYFDGEFWEDAKRYCYEVIAWMPLPEPYKAEGSDKE